MNSSKTSQQYNFDEPLHENQLEELYIWLDAIPLSRKKKNLSRDFSDASKLLKSMDYKIFNEKTICFSLR